MEFNDNKPIYMQMADSIMDSIVRGKYPKGDRMPSVREYAISSGVNPNTVQRTYTWLQNQGLISMKRGIGYFVNDNAVRDILEMQRKHFMEHETSYFMERLASFGVTPEQLCEDYKAFLASRKD